LAKMANFSATGRTRLCKFTFTPCTVRRERESDRKGVEG
jgi:hypothetical protein